MNRILAVTLAVAVLGCGAQPAPSGVELSLLDGAIRDYHDMSVEDWESLDHVFRHIRCLRFRATEIREVVSVADGPVSLIAFYPMWVESLKDCSTLYPMDADTAEQLRESLGARAAAAIGQETASYLHLHRLNGAVPLDQWRTFAIVGLAEVADVLEEAGY